jgi:two-component system NarL family sensor kinase
MTDIKFHADTETLKRRNRELLILNSIAEALNREVDLQRALHSALAQVAELLDLRTGWIWLLREETGESYLAAAQNLPPALANAPHRMEGSCYCLDTYRLGDLHGAANVNVVTCSRLKGLINGADGLRFHASIPLYAYGKKLGVLNVASSDWRELTDNDLRLLHTVGDLISIAIERARLFAKSSEWGAVQERNRLAREIHDTLAQGLAAIILQLETADAFLDAGVSPNRAKQVLQRALEMARANLEEARRSVMDLRAAPLEGRTLAEALTALVNDEATRHHLTPEVDLVGGSRPLPAHIEVGLYRVAQEAIANIVRHADAQHIHLRLVTTPTQVQMEIEDDGHGFDRTDVQVDRYGLIGLNERVKLMNGALKIHSSPGIGTRIHVSIPLQTS